jgi:peptidyl-prolyl cis-trans isomerase D
LFDLVHKHKRVVQVIIALLVVPFAIWGIESYRVGGSADTVATVNGLKVSVREFEEALRNQQDQLRRMLGRNFDPAIMDTAESRAALLDSLVERRLVESAAIEANLTIPDEVLVDLIHSVPAFQVEGRFSKAQYEATLKTQNPPLTSAQFEARVRQDLALQQLARAVGDAAIVPRSVAARLGALETQQREVSDARIPAQQFMGQVKVDDARLKSYYEENPAQFRQPERVRAEYVLLSADALARELPVSDADVKAQWDARYGAAFAEREAARKKAEGILAEVRKDPQRFAEMAKAQSDDKPSAEQGGDLGFQPRGSFVQPFEDALYKMKPGQISGVVETEFGFHILRLEGVRKNDGKEERRASHILVAAQGDARPLAEMRPQIEAELKKERGQQRFAEAAENFSNMVYEQSDSLKPVAERFKLTIRSTPWIAKSAQQELGPLDNPKLLAALFSDDAIAHKRNTDAVEVAPGTLVAARVVEHQPAVQRPFDEVKGQIAETLRQREAAELARKEGERRLEALRKGQEAGGLKWSAPKSVSRREPQGLRGDILRAVMTADVAKLPAYEGVAGEDGYLLLRVSKVTQPGDAKAADAEALQRAGQIYGAAQYQAFLASLRADADIEVRKEALERK